MVKNKLTIFLVAILALGLWTNCHHTYNSKGLKDWIYRLSIEIPSLHSVEQAQCPNAFYYEKSSYDGQFAYADLQIAEDVYSGHNGWSKYYISINGP